MRHDGGRRARPTAGLRERAVPAVETGRARPEVTRADRVSWRSHECWLARACRGEPLTDKPRPGTPPKSRADRRAALTAQAAAYPDVALDEHRARGVTVTGVRIGRSTMGREPAHLRPTLKQRRRTPGSGTRRRGRRGAPRGRASTRPPSSSSTKRRLRPLGPRSAPRAPCGERAVGRVPRCRREHVS